jgi:hypothetical protein
MLLRHWFCAGHEDRRIGVKIPRQGVPGLVISDACG